MNLFYLLSSILSLLCIWPVQAATAGYPVKIAEIFTIMDQKVRWDFLTKNKILRQNINLQINALDGIKRLEAALSNQLPIDPEQAEQTALHRIQQLDKKAMEMILQAAIGLTKAMQYGLYRYPAIG